MAEYVVSFIVERLGDLLIDEAKLIHGVDGEVQQIHDQLRWMQAFLKDADARQKDERIRTWVADVRKLAYDADDVLESFLLGAESKRGGAGIKNILKRYACILSECVVLYKVGSDIRGIKTKISELKSCLETYGIKSLTEGQEDSTSITNRQSELRRTYSHVAEEDFVGLKGVVEKLVEQLLVCEDRDNYCRVVSICGMGGIGKTTLAKRIYNHPKVKSHFKSFAWVCISQQWQTKDILQQVLIKLVPDQREQLMKFRDEELIKKLFEVQQNEACFIVLDDIWSKDAWECLKHAFPMGKTASKLLLTGRNTDVATRVDPKGFHYLPRILNENECWELLKKKALIKRDHTEGEEDVEKMEKLGREMVKHCRGLPLAVVVLGGLLVTKKSLKEWEKVHQSIKSYLRSGDHGGVLGMLALSYTDLPYQLKPCFLYLGKFQEDSEIETERLYQLWIAESMVRSKDQREGETMMDVAECYLGELVQRCMVQVIQEEEPQFRRFKSCRLHDLMRDLCLFMAKEEDFLNVVNFHHQDDHWLAEASSSSSKYNNKARRLVIYCDKEASGNGDVALNKETSKHLRSFLYLSASEMYRVRISTTVRSHINDFKLLRVLAIEGLRLNDGSDLKITNLVDDYAFSKSICSLIHLRYLSFRDTYLIMFPSSITNLKHLQTLDLRGDFGWFLPCMATALRKMGRLRHLYLPEDINSGFKAPKLRLDGLSNLETLEIPRAAWCNVEDLLKLINLRKLKAEWVNKLEDVERIVSYLLSTNPNHFRHSSLFVTVGRSSTEEWNTSIRQLLGCGSLHELHIGGSIRDKLLGGRGHDHNFSFSPSLTKLTLRDCELKEDPMPILENFPNLRVVSLKHYAYSGKEMNCSAVGFPQLRYLELRRLVNLEKWRVDKGAMPNLSCLIIDSCIQLEELPDGLRYVTTLRELDIILMPKTFQDRIRLIDGEEGADFYKIQHVPSITIKD